MLVDSSPPRAPFPQAARPLPALHTNVLASSHSSSQLQWPDSPESVYQSPLQRHFRNVLERSPSPSPLSSHSRYDLPTKQLANHVIATSPCTRNKDHPLHPHQHPHSHPSRRSNACPGSGIDGTDEKANLVTRCSNANARTRGAFKPQRSQKGTNSWQLKQFAEATLGSGSLKKVVRLPEGEDKDEWLAINGIQRPTWWTRLTC